MQTDNPATWHNRSCSFGGLLYVKSAGAQKLYSIHEKRLPRLQPERESVFDKERKRERERVFLTFEFDPRAH